MHSRIQQAGRVRPGHAFQADRYSFRERLAHRVKNPFAEARTWWREASGFERFARAWFWAVCAVMGLLIGSGSMLFIAAIWVFLTG